MERYIQMKRRHTQELIDFPDMDTIAQRALFDRHQCERQEAVAADTTGEGYIYQMFYYELANHEYTFTEELDDTLECLGLTMADIDADPRLRLGLDKACANQKDCCG